MNKKKGLTFLAAVLCLALLTACGNNEPDADASIGEQVDHTIYGIDPGAGIMKMTRDAIEDYDLSEWTLNESSDAAMMAELEKRYKNEEPIIITGWTPHWMFQAFDLKYLDDPKKSYGEEEEIDTIVRLGLKDDEPAAYELLTRFEWTPDDMEKVMNEARESSPEEAATAWFYENKDRVEKWGEGLEKADGRKLKVAYVAWDSEVASSNVIKVALEKLLDYKVELVQLDNGTMWASVAKGDSDAIVSAWLPATHEDQYDRFKDKVEKLGANLKGTRLGLAVPTYMEDVNSIEDLK